MATHVVIMAGGVGSRFWPVSTPQCPKQFIDVLGVGRSLIQLTFDRFAGVCDPENVWVVTNASYVDMVHKQLPGVPATNILAEPVARNTAPCIAWACWTISAKDPDANIVVTPSDAVVMDSPEFRRVIGNALRFTSGSDSVVTIGITPNRPETGYGYVHKGEQEGHGEMFSVVEFKEKPSLDVAKTYLESRDYLWNAGIFVWGVRTIMDCIRLYKPEMASLMDRIAETGDVCALFPECEKISIDFAVMEPAAAQGKVFTHPAEFGWSDLGNWQSLHGLMQKDVDANLVIGPASLFECSNCVVHVEDSERVVLQGLDGYIVAAKDGNVLVVRRSEEQRIKEFIAG